MSGFYQWLDGLPTWQLVLVSTGAGVLVLHAVLGLVLLATQLVFWWEDWR